MAALDAENIRQFEVISISTLPCVDSPMDCQRSQLINLKLFIHFCIQPCLYPIYFQILWKQIQKDMALSALVHLSPSTLFEAYTHGLFPLV